MCFVAYPGAPFALFVAYRVALEIVFVAVYRVGLREGSDLDRLFFWHSLSYRAAAVIISLMAIHLGGIRSPYMHGISIVALVWAALEPVPWRQALPTFVSIGLAFPAVIGLRRRRVSRRTRRVADRRCADRLRQQLRVRARVVDAERPAQPHASGRRSSRRGRSAATSSKRSSGAAAWAKCGEPDIGSWPDAPRSS